MLSNIKVTIITVCYNSQATIRDTIESVLNQTYTNIEYIIVDGKSTDKTLDIIKGYEPDFGNRLILISEPDKGIYDAMNKGISKASGELIGIINSDDFYERDAVQKIVDKYQGEKYCVLYGMERILEKNEEKQVTILSHTFLKERMIAHPSCFVSKETYLRFGIYNISHPSAADYDLMLRFYDSGMITFTPIYSLIANYRIGGMSSSTKGYLDSLKVRQEHGLMSKKMYIVSYLVAIIRYRIFKILRGKNENNSNN